MNILVTYSDDSMTRAKELCCSSALKNGVDVVWPQSDYMLGGEFERFNKDILSQPRGCGYWLWKPYIIYRAMLQMNDGEILIYSDAGIEFINSVGNVIERMDEDIFFFTNGWPHVEWCKMDCIKAIIHEEFEPKPEHLANVLATGNRNMYMEWLKEFKQVQASVIFFKVNQKTKDFVKEWLLYCQMPGFIDDSPSKLPNYPTFAEHRHDQAILTCMQIKYGYKLHFWPTNYSEHIRHTAQPEDNYPSLFNHHRKRNNEW